jgi:hypothetical protein
VSVARIGDRNLALRRRHAAGTRFGFSPAIGSL